MLKRSQKVSEYELPIKIEPQKEGGFVVTSPAWKDCYAQGDSIELYKEEGLKIPLN